MSDFPLNYNPQNYLELNQPRRPDRAKAWLVTWPELMTILSELKEEWLNHMTLDAYEIPEKDLQLIKAKIAKLLRKREPDLRRGDMIYLEPELGDQRRRNFGIYIYDGVTLNR